MSTVLSIKVREVTSMSEELQELLANAYNQQGHLVEIPEAMVEGVHAGLSLEVADEILAIRRRERAVSAQTLAFSFA